MSDHPDPHQPETVTAHRVCHFDDLTDNTITRFDIDGRAIALALDLDEIYAIDDTCTHANYSLSEGELDTVECTVECPKHGAKFSLRTGEALTLPATKPVHCYAVEVHDNEVFVSLPDLPGESADQ